MEGGIVKIQVIAELLSAVAAFITVGLAIIELANRSKAKKADVAIVIYSNYLFAAQQIGYMVSNVETLAGNCKNMSVGDQKAFAKAHLIDPSLPAVLQKIENEFVSNTNYNTEEGKRNSIMILNYTGSASNLILTVNTFYTMLIENESMPPEQIINYYDRIKATYAQINTTAPDVEEMLRKNLKTLHNHSNIYIVSLFVATVLFLLVCLFL